MLRRAMYGISSLSKGVLFLALTALGAGSVGCGQSERDAYAAYCKILDELPTKAFRVPKGHISSEGHRAAEKAMMTNEEANRFFTSLAEVVPGKREVVLRKQMTKVGLGDCPAIDRRLSHEPNGRPPAPTADGFTYPVDQPIRAFTWSPNGDILAVVPPERPAVELWRVPDGAAPILLGTARLEPLDRVDNVVFSPNGEHLIIATISESQVISVAEPAKFGERASRVLKGPSHCDFTPGGDVACWTRRTNLDVHKVDDLMNPQVDITAGTYSSLTMGSGGLFPDGKKSWVGLATPGWYNRLICHVDAPPKHAQPRMDTLTDGDIAFCIDRGHKLAVVKRDGGLQLVRTFSGHAPVRLPDVELLSVSPDGRYLVTKSSTGLEIRNVAKPERSGQLLDVPAVHLASLSPDNTRLAYTTWNPETATEARLQITTVPAATIADIDAVDEK